MTVERPTALRMASLHLRLGQLGLARAELEALAGGDALDHAGMVDLVEARWRSGDLAGAGAVAGALLDHGQVDLLTLVVAAESSAADGRPEEARRLAARAEGLADGALDAVFAGMPNSRIWSGADVPAVEARPAVARPVRSPAPSVAPPARPSAPETPSAAAEAAFARGRSALAAGDDTTAAIRLGVALRLDPQVAGRVLDALGDWERHPTLALVAGDALRLLGREADALAAFEHAHGPT
jgi:tetratricopeptide (TPR) repeat protein